MSSFDYPSYAEHKTTFMAFKPPDEKYGFVGDSILISTGEERDIEEYKKVIQERVVPYSFAKRSRYNGEPFTVGAIARMNLFGKRLTGKAGEYFKKLYSKRWLKNPFFNNLAQAIEILYSLETIPKLVDSIIKLKEPMTKQPSNILSSGTGTGATEAPRGILYHHYSIQDGLIVDCDIATPTAQNLDDIERYLRIAVNNLLSKETEDNLELKLEILVRAYDPCISCSAHSIKIEGIHNLFNLHTDEH